MFKIGDQLIPCEWIEKRADSLIGSNWKVLETRNHSKHGQQVRVMPDGKWLHHGHFSLAPALSPIRTVTRKEIVHGTYGGVVIHEDNINGKPTPFVKFYAQPSADELRAAARIFNEIADALTE